MFVNRKHTEETKIKMRQAALGRVNSPETRKKIRKNHAKAWLGRKHTDEQKKKIGTAHKGKTISLEQRKKLSEAHKKLGSFVKEKNPNWKGGVTPVVFALRTSTRMKVFRFDVLRRDRFMCQECGDDRGGNLEVDHIEPFSYIIENIKNEYGVADLYEKALQWEPLWDLENGRTLCIPCHKKTPTWGTKARFYKPNP